MPRLLIILFFAGLMFSCNKKDDKLPPDNTNELMNVSYGTDPKQTMDIYLPVDRNADSTKLAILIHGGTWSSGDKLDLDQYIAELRKRLPTYAFANINYRLATNDANKFPSQENDTRMAVQYLSDHEGEYNISGKFAIIGVSAGGLLALLQGYKYAEVHQPKALVSVVGPTDLVDLYNHPINIATSIILEGVIGYSVTENPTIYQESSPVNYVTAQSAPTLLLYGAKDSLVPVNQPHIMDSVLSNENVVHELKIYATGGHTFYGTNLTDTYARITAFLNAHVQ